MPLRLFISHAHEDKSVAAALQQLISEVFPSGDSQSVKVDYSSDDAPTQGPAAGAEWLEWVLETVRVADVCVVILSENSVDTPWLTWEAGAVTGAALSTVSPSTPGGGRVIPLLFGIPVDRIPAPLQSKRAVNGTEPVEMTRLLYRLHALSGSTAAFDDAAARRSAGAFVDAVSSVVEASILKRSPTFRFAPRVALHLVSFAGLVMEPLDGEIANGIRVGCGRFSGDTYQQWRLAPVRKGVFRITTVDSSKCLSVQDDSTQPKAPVILWDYETVESQHWRFASDPGGASSLNAVRIFNCASDLCLMPNLSNGQVIQTQFTNILNQDWWPLLPPVIDFD